MCQTLSGTRDPVMNITDTFTAPMEPLIYWVSDMKYIIIPY